MATRTKTPAPEPPQEDAPAAAVPPAPVEAAPAPPARRKKLYVLLYPGGKIAFYVGISENPDRRLGEHLTLARRGRADHPVYAVLREILAAGEQPILHVRETIPPEVNARRREEQIKELLVAAGHPICNLHDGQPMTCPAVPPAPVVRPPLDDPALDRRITGGRPAVERFTLAPRSTAVPDPPSTYAAPRRSWGTWVRASGLLGVLLLVAAGALWVRGLAVPQLVGPQNDQVAPLMTAVTAVLDRRDPAAGAVAPPTLPVPPTIAAPQREAASAPEQPVAHPQSGGPPRSGNPPAAAPPAGQEPPPDPAQGAGSPPPPPTPVPVEPTPAPPVPVEPTPAPPVEVAAEPPAAAAAAAQPPATGGGGTLAPPPSAPPGAAGIAQFSQELGVVHAPGSAFLAATGFDLFPPPADPPADPPAVTAPPLDVTHPPDPSYIGTDTPTNNDPAITSGGSFGGSNP
jgi:hypothetical protein